ncbi:MAG: hypothetical protein PHF29_07180 [Candidatus Riflebacteria bacterium]|nr:hypothetical protein [Candidatus Riflebacteria bacterium]
MKDNKLSDAMGFFSQLVTDGGNVDTQEKLNFMRLCWNNLMDMQLEVTKLKSPSEDMANRQDKVSAEQWMLNHILYIGNEIPEPIANDNRDKFVLLGYPQQMIDAVDCK